MKNRGYTVGIALFFAGLIGLWWLDYAHVPDRDAAKMSEGRVLPGLWEVRPDDVRRLEIEGGPQRLRLRAEAGESLADDHPRRLPRPTRRWSRHWP